MDHRHNKTLSMKYRSEDDKAYGVAGMALGLAVFDVSRLSAGIDLDESGFACLQFDPSFFQAGNPLMSAKDSWKHAYGNFQVLMGLSIANAMSRKMLLDHGTIDRKMRDFLLDEACGEGMLTCQLEREEVEPLFDRYFSHLMQVFSNRDIARAVSDFALLLRRERAIAGSDMQDFFDPWL